MCCWCMHCPHLRSTRMMRTANNYDSRCRLVQVAIGTHTGVLHVHVASLIHVHEAQCGELSLMFKGPTPGGCLFHTIWVAPCRWYTLLSCTTPLEATTRTTCPSTPSPLSLMTPQYPTQTAYPSSAVTVTRSLSCATSSPTRTALMWP